MFASTAEIGTKQRFYIKCRGLREATMLELRLVAGGNCLFKRSSDIEGSISGIIETCKHFIV